MEEKILQFLKSASSNEIKPFLNALMCQNYGSFEQFTDFLDHCQPNLSCNENWTTKVMICNCKNCGLYSNSCICIPCLLEGNHIQENHQIHLCYSSSGTCDCAHSESWDKRGFCKKHCGQSIHPEDNLPEDLRKHLSTIFEVLKKFIIQTIETETMNFFNVLFEFIIQLSGMGAGVLRLASLSFGDEIFLKTMINNCHSFSFEQSKKIKSFITSYANDEFFSLQFGKFLFPCFRNLYEKTLELSHVQYDKSKEPPLIGPSIIVSNSFHFFHHLAKGENGLNFNEYFNEIIPILFDFMKSNPTLFEGRNSSELFEIFWIARKVLQYYFEHDMKEEIKKFFINIASSFSQIEGYIQPIDVINSLDDNSSYYDYELFYKFILNFYPLAFSLAKKVDYIPEIIEIFVHFLFTNDQIDRPSFIFILHKLAISTLKNAKNAKEEFDKIIRKDDNFSIIDKKIKNKEDGFQKFKNVYEFIYFRACLIPINSMSFAMLKSFDLLNKDEYPKSFIKAFDKYNRPDFKHVDVPFLLSLIQFMFSFTEDKNGFLMMIESKFNIFDPKNSQSKSERMFCFILIVSYLIFNDPKLIGKKKRIIQLIFMTVFNSDPKLKRFNINYYSGPVQLNKSYKWYNEVKSENNWHIIIPFISPYYLFKDMLPNILKEMPNKNNSVLLPFPDFADSEIIDLRSLMKSTYLYAILYDIMYDSSDQILYHYSLNLFILLYNNEQLISNTKCDRKINAVSIDEIVNQIPSNFIEFCDIKINYKRGGCYLSLIDLIENTGSIGLNALNQTLHRKSKKEMQRIARIKSNIKNIKKEIFSKYNKQSLNFNFSTITNLATDIKTKPNDKMFIFCDISVLTIPDFLETQYHFDFPIKKEDDEDDEIEKINENKLLSSFMKKRNHLKKSSIINTCGHYSNDDSVRVCPHCQLMSNFLMPNFNATENPEIYSTHINNFNRVFGGIKTWNQMLINMIIILDFRSRLKPEIIQDEITYLIYRNLFIMVKLLAPKINLFIFTDRKSKLGTFFFDFIYRNKFDSTNFVDNFFLNYVSKFNYKIDYEFLKRIELIRLFYINKKLENIIDIDEHLSFRNLIKMYKITEDFIEATKYTKYQFYKSIHDIEDISEIEKIKVDFDIDQEQLPAFRGIELPDNFLQIIKDPFNIKLEIKNGEEKMICLATGEIITRHFLNRNMRMPRELSCHPILLVNGLKTNGIGIWKSPNKFTMRRSIYRNRKGNENVGFKNGDLVFLDNERYIDLIDEFISGWCTRNINNERYEFT